jgi:kynurenine formamidase
MAPRENSSGPGSGWTPPSYTVDDNLKVVGGYRPAGVNNWGRWGEADQLGTLNLIGAEQVRYATSLPEHGRVISLSLPISGAAPRHPTRAPAKNYVAVSGTDAVSDNPIWLSNFVYTDDALDMATHGTTHWDALAHVIIDHTMYNGFWAGATSSGGAEVLAIGNHHATFAGRGVLLDIARHLGVDWLEPTTIIQPELLDEVAAAQGLQVRPGDIVLLRTGSLKRWWTLDSDEARLEWFSASPGPGLACVQWYAEHDVAASAADNFSFEAVPGEMPETRMFPVHQPLIVDLGMPIGELWVLDELADACAQDGSWEFLLVAPPLHLPRAVGSPLNPIVLK